MSTQRGIILLTVAPEVADRFDWVAGQFELTQEQVATAAIAMLSSMVEQRDPRAIKFLTMIRDASHRSLDAPMMPIHTAGG